MVNTRPKRRFRTQQGVVVERSDGFYIRFIRDGENGERTKVTEFLTAKTPQYPSAECTAIKLLRDSYMTGINRERHAVFHVGQVEAPITVGGFWSATYLPWAKANKRASTATHYESDWRMYVKPELEIQPIKNYTTVQACELLDYMVTKKDLNKSTLAHVKSLCSGIFSHAVRKGIITVNPWREAKESVKVRPAKIRVAYTPEETVAILNALTRTDAKLFFAMCAVLGMRPSEVAASKWENVADGVLKITEAAPDGVLGNTKTERSKRSLKLYEPVLTYLTAWHEASGKPSAGLMFTNGKREPVNSSRFAKYHITPEAKKVCARWCGLYAGRHGAATTLYNQTGDIRASYQILGNSLEVVMSTYVKPDVAAGEAGMTKYAEVLKAATDKALDTK